MAHDPTEAQAASLDSTPKAERTLVDRICLFFYRHRETRAVRMFGTLCWGFYIITDTRGFMVVMHTISFCVVAACIWAAVKTGSYAYYLASAAFITCLSLLWPKFTTRAMDKWRKTMREKRNHT